MGGGATRAHNIAVGLVRAGCDVSVISAAPHSPNGNIPKRYRWKPLRIEYDSGMKLIRTFVSLMESRGFARRAALFLSFVLSSLFAIPLVRKTDVVFAANPNITAMFAGLVYKKLNRCPLVQNVDDLWPEVLYDLGVRRDSFIGRLGELMARLAYGIDISKLKPPQPTSRDTARVLFVGRLVPQKGIFLGIKALSRLELDYRLLVVGTGPDRGRLEEYCKEKGVDVQFFSFVKDSRLYNLCANSDILFMPSLYEGLPIVGIEGAGNDLPVVAFEEARIQQVVCEENRELIAHTGEIDELSNALDKLIEDKNLRRAIGRKNRENVLSNLTEERMVDNTSISTNRLFEGNYLLPFGSGLY